MNETEQRIYDYLIGQAIRMAQTSPTDSGFVAPNDRSAACTLELAYAIKMGAHRV